jgi:hypothetical protein
MTAADFDVDDVATPPFPPRPAASHLLNQEAPLWP